MSEQGSPFHKAEQLRPILYAANSGGSGKTARQHIADVFTVSPDHDAILQSRLKQTRRLIRDVQREVKKIPDIDHDLYLSWVTQALKMFTVSNLGIGWSGGYIQPEILIRLDFCIDALKKYFTEEHIAEEKLKGIRKSTEELKADILEAGFEHELEEALIDALQALLTAMDEYYLRGTVRLKEGLSIAVGTVVVNFKLFNKPEEDSRWQKYSERFGQIVRGLWSVIQFSIKNKAELQQGWTVVQGLIEGGPQTPPENK